MSEDFYNERVYIKAHTGKIIAETGDERQAEIIAKAINYYFKDTFTRNYTVAMMHENACNALNRIADFAEKNDYTVNELIDFMRETANEMEAMAAIASMRDELKFDKPKD